MSMRLSMTDVFRARSTGRDGNWGSRCRWHVHSLRCRSRQLGRLARREDGRGQAAHAARRDDQLPLTGSAPGVGLRRSGLGADVP